MNWFAGLWQEVHRKVWREEKERKNWSYYTLIKINLQNAMEYQNHSFKDVKGGGDLHTLVGEDRAVLCPSKFKNCFDF